MSEPSHSQTDSMRSSPELRQSALFNGMVLQQANMAMMFLGKAPRPDTDKPTVDLHAASLFIDTLDMLEAKTRGNLSPDEAGMLRETLTGLRIAFVAASDAASAAGGSGTANVAPAGGGSTSRQEGASPEGKSDAPDAGSGGDGDADRKKFVKRY